MKKLVIVRFQENPTRNPELSMFLFEHVIADKNKAIAIPLPLCVVTNCTSEKSAAEVTQLINTNFPDVNISVTEVGEEIVTSTSNRPLTMDQLLDIIAEKGGVEQLSDFEKSELQRLRASL